jgi:hypothetical protein
MTPMNARFKIIKEMLSTFILVTAGLLLGYGIATSIVMIYSSISK